MVRVGSFACDDCRPPDDLRRRLLRIAALAALGSLVAASAAAQSEVLTGTYVGNGQPTPAKSPDLVSVPIS